MRNPRYIVQKAPGVEGDPIPEDEPCLVIRAQDILAVPMLQTYLAFLTVGYYDAKVYEELEAHLDALMDWQSDNISKVKWVDR